MHVRWGTCRLGPLDTISLLAVHSIDAQLDCDAWQVTSEPTLAPLLSELIHSTEGQEVRLRAPADYHIHDLKKTSFAEVTEYARTKSETAIG